MVEKPEKFAHLVGLIYDAATDSRRWEKVLQELRQILDAGAVAWSDYNFETKEGRILHAVGYEPYYIRNYAGVYAPLNMWLRPGEWYIPGTVSLGEEILPGEELVKTRFYNEWLKPQGFFHRVCAVVNREDKKVFYLEAVRPRIKGAYDSQALSYLSWLVPHLLRATQRNYHFWRLAVILEVIDRLPFMVLVVDNQARPLCKNRMAEEVLNRQDGLWLSPEKLSVSGAKASAQFNALISSAAATSAGKGSHGGGAMIIRRHGNLPPLWVVVSPLRRRLRNVIGQEDKVALVFVHAPECIGMVQETTLKTFYGLTPAEQRLALLILEGCRLDEAAEKLEISKNTARTHMKRIYVKTNTKRQSDLVRLLLSGPMLTYTFGSWNELCAATQ